MRVLRTLFKIFAGLVLFVIAGIAAILGLLRLEHGFAVELPAPTGSYAVGGVTYHWVDPSRIDSLAPVTGQKRELIVWIWYPATPKTTTPPAEYQTAPWRNAVASEQGTVMTKFFTRDLALVRSHSFASADVSHAQRTYPVVIMKSGIGALATDYTTLAEDLASHGFIVVGSDSPYSTFVVVFPDGHVAKRTPAGHLRDKLPPLSRRQARCKAGIDMDGNPFGSVIEEGLTQPFIFLLSDHSGEKVEDTREILANVHSICESDKGGCQIATIRGFRHFNFSDQALLKDHYMGRAIGLLGPVGERRGLAIAAAFVDAFFEIQLKNAPRRLLTNLVKEYPEIQFDSR